MGLLLWWCQKSRGTEKIYLVLFLTTGCLFSKWVSKNFASDPWGKNCSFLPAGTYSLFLLRREQLLYASSGWIILENSSIIEKQEVYGHFLFYVPWVTSCSVRVTGSFRLKPAPTWLDPNTLHRSYLCYRGGMSNDKRILFRCNQKSAEPTRKKIVKNYFSFKTKNLQYLPPIYIYIYSTIKWRLKLG